MTYASCAPPTRIRRFWSRRGGCAPTSTIASAWSACGCPLRDRKEDILLLADHYIHIYNQRMHKQILGLSQMTGDRELLAELTGFALTRGILCAMRRPALPEVSALCAYARRLAVLDGIVDPANVGAIFRSAAALGMDGVLLTPSCCDPLYRRAARVSMGAVFQIPWCRLDRDQSDWPGLLREQGFKTAALALRDSALPIDDPALAREPRLALVLGTEGDGLSEPVIQGCDYTVLIPMSHGVNSLNVAAASAVAFWQLGRR